MLTVICLEAMCHWHKHLNSFCAADKVSPTGRWLPRQPSSCSTYSAIGATVLSWVAVGDGRVQVLNKSPHTKNLSIGTWTVWVIKKWGNKDHMGPPKWSTLKKTIKQPTQFSKHYNNIPLLDDARAHIKDVSVDIPFCQQNIILHMTRPGTFCSMRALPTNMHHPHHAYREVYSVHYHF
jgi:hypothetical protein